jgi:hypothetical protein
MSSNEARMILLIDVFGETEQRANAAAHLKPRDLVAAVLVEFKSQEHLGDNPDGYYLANKATGKPLDDRATLGLQLNQGDRLMLLEREAALPPGTARPSRPIYLREVRGQRTFPVQWAPAVIGRRSEHEPENELVAVDLRGYESGLRVSRRHVRLTERDGQFYVENLSKSNNPVWLLGQGRPRAVTDTPLPIAPGDVIRLERSDLELKLIAREAQAPAAPVAESGDAGEIDAESAEVAAE